MDNFDLKKYLAEGGLMKETLDDEVWAMVEKMVEMIGAEAVVDAIVKAMSTADAKLYLSAIMRDYDLKEDQPTVFDDKNMDALLNIILKYVKDPSDAERELEKFEDGGYDALSPELLANLDRDPKFKAWYKDLHSIKEDDAIINEGHGLSLQDVGILRYLLKMIKADIKIQSPSGRKDAIRVLQFLIDSNIEVDKTKDLSKEKNLKK